ncbi:PREDICTED: gastrula zinc finger protein XlCGF26.1-like [Papilio xuthus]|uniref:Gastrula zinc finger protein XlCGF26.1-like n=1 Tax=Papilio xuthus TaxID=66420 RepID=A0AAJ6ZTJ6_PAPXU|nr:PREDICTED: gastrula zinc finger protein XlCGF26.1-like [Papilio xuthus]XP_013178972.1 PREDICTED: gastrula zinc finger protein XlCGF26.1-like [Papilio xuthus]
MATPVRTVNIVPLPKVKKEISEDEDEDTVSCKICYKHFVSELALRNHARMEHTEIYINGDPALWTKVVTKKPSVPKIEEDKSVEEKTRELIASMTPTSITKLASEDVSYIIVKSEDTTERPQIKKKKVEKIDKDKIERQKVMTPKKERDPQPITGPFECLQPSTLVAEGTCHQIFFSCCDYSVHFRDEHTRRRKGLRCQVCEKPLNAVADPQAIYSCGVCGSGFQSNKELSEHSSQAHVKLKPFECTICHKRFTQQGGLQQHTRMHTGYRPFSCTICSKTFTQKSGLQQHFRIHTKVRPYRCVICNKSFCQSVHLKQHMRTHTNVSPFQCGICDKRFKQSSHLNYHLKYHNPATLSDEQKKKYDELVGLIGSNPVELCEPQLGDDKVESQGDEWCVTFVDTNNISEDSSLT